MFFLQVTTTKLSNTFSASDWSAIGAVAQAIIAIVNVCLASYIFIYQRRHNNTTDEHIIATNKQNIEHSAQLNKELIKNNAQLNEQNIKLQWFKELIVQPNIEAINSFYANLYRIKEKIVTSDLPTEAKEDINNFIKAELTTLRKSFIDTLLMVDKSFADQLLQNLDNLIDDITNAIFSDELKLNVPTVYEKFIGSKISYSRNSLLAQLYNYKGISNT